MFQAWFMAIEKRLGWQVIINGRLYFRGYSKTTDSATNRGIREFKKLLPYNPRDKRTQIHHIYTHPLGTIIFNQSDFYP
jgi:hypothetical protein